MKDGFTISVEGIQEWPPKMVKIKKHEISRGQIQIEEREEVRSNIESGESVRQRELTAAS